VSLLLRLFKRVAIGIVVLVVVLIALLYWLLLTNSGLQTGAKYVRDYLPESLDFESVEGELARRLLVRGVRVETDAATIELPELVLQCWCEYSAT